MSVEIKNDNASSHKKTDKPNGFHAEWDNILRLYRLQFIQKRLVPHGTLFIYMAAFIVVISFFSQISLIFKPGDSDYIRGIGEFIFICLLIVILCISGSTYDILSAENISIYPGTVRTRFISRLLFDYTLITAVIVFSVICRLLGVGITNIIISLSGNSRIIALFDLKSMILRASACLCYVYMIHSAYVLFFVAATKIGIKKTIAALFTIGVIILLALKTTPLTDWISRIVKFYAGEGLGLAKIAPRTLLTTLILTVLSFVVMSTVRAWKDHTIKEFLAFSIVYSYLLGCVITVGGSIVFERMSYSPNFPKENLEEMIANNEFIVHDEKIQAGVSDGGLLEQSYTQNVNSLDITASDANIAWMNLDKAISRGMVPKDTTLADGEMLVRTAASTYKHHGEYIYKNFIESIHLSVADSKCKLDIDKNMLLYDAFLAETDPILGDDVENMDNLGEVYFTMENCQIYVIFNKNDITNRKALHSRYGYYEE